MLKRILVLSTLVLSVVAQSATPVTYQAKAIVALMSDSKVIDALPGGYITDIKYISPFTYDIISRSSMNEKICVTQVITKITNNDDWNPEYGVDSVGATNCK